MVGKVVGNLRDWSAHQSHSETYPSGVAVFLSTSSPRVPVLMCILVASEAGENKPVGTGIGQIKIEERWVWKSGCCKCNCMSNVKTAVAKKKGVCVCVCERCDYRSVRGQEGVKCDVCQRDGGGGM